MMLDDWKSGKLSPDDPWAVEALKRGLIQPRTPNPYTNPDLSPKETRGFQPDPMAQTVRALPGKLLSQADENLTKNITALTPKPKESPHGSIRMPRMSDAPENAGNFVMAGPIAVEQALGKIVAKVLPAKAIQDKLLQAGASKAELEARGVTQFLESKGNRPIFPKEVAKHLEENPYQLKEITKSDRAELRPVFQLKYPDGTHLGAPFNTEEEAIAAMNDLRDPRAALGRGQQEPLSITETLVDRPISPPKFESYQTPGGENYREILMTAPNASQRLSTVQHPSGKGYALQKSDGSYVVAGPDTIKPGTPLMWDTATAADKYGVPFHRAGFNSSHWDEPNVLAHMRVNDRKLPSGEKALHVEEWQSDWSNALRQEKGYSPPSGNHAPSHPLVDNWQDLMARRTLKEAADGGYDRLTWTTGAQQADRYDLSKHFDALHYRKLKDGTFGVVGTTVDGKTMDIADRATAEELPGIIGKDVARRIVAGEGKESTATAGKMRLDGLDLKVGGEWAKKLYDESMVNRFNKIGKRYGVQVEDVPIGLGDKKYTYEGLKILGKTGETVHSLKITPEMRQAIGAVKFHPFADLPGPTGAVK
jgi:hypothetical protein